VAKKAEKEPTQAREGPRISLATQVLLALALGLMTGLFLGEIVAPLKVVGDAFIRLLQITVIPYISVALITGLGRLDYDEVKQLALKGGGILLLLWAIAITLVLFLPLSYPDWPSRSLFQKSSIEAAAPPDFLQLYIPSNPFFSLANGIVPAVVVFSIMIGLALTGSRNKEILIEPLALLGEVLSKITGFVAKLAPIGVFALIADAAGTMGFGDLARLQVYVVVAVSMLSIIGLWLLPGLVSCVSPLRHRDVVRRLRTPLVTGFATGSSLVVLPMLAQICKELVAEAHARPAILEDDEERASSVDVLIPTFFSFPTIGAVMSLGFVLFAGWYIGSSVATGAYPAVLAAGFASLFGGTALAIPFTLGLAELPRDLFRLFISTDVIVSRFGTYVSVMHYATIALIGTFAVNDLVRIRRWRLLRVVAIGVLLVAGALIGVRAFYTHVVVVPYTQDEFLKGLHKLRRAQPSVVHRGAPTPEPGAEPSGPRSLSEITDSGVLRVCYVHGNYPLSFFNTQRELVGFDIEMAHRFAARLSAPPTPWAAPRAKASVGLEFVPVTQPDDLVTGYCDALFNSMALALGRPDRAAHTIPFETITLAFIVPDHRREEFSTWKAIRAKGELTIALSFFQALEGEVSNLVPQAKAVRLLSLEEQIGFFETFGEGADAFLDAAEEGAAWTILYPRFTVVVPRPVVQLPVVYAIAPDNPSLLRAMNEWLLIEKATGGVDEIYDYWIQGRTAQVQPPRWSVIRDVLGWIDGGGLRFQ
jgi:Na+/H+-dicarboxylate symporter/ABC-type amino acid transport substrate-binding protein